MTAPRRSMPAVPAIAGSTGLASMRALAAGFILITGFVLGVDAVLRLAMPAVFTTGAGAFPVAGRVFTLAYVAIFTVAGCYVAACLAPERPMLHALGLGLAGLLVTAAAAIVSPHTAPVWQHAAALLLVMPCAWLGGRVREREVAYRAARNSTIISG
jgi:hypothetical protein